MSASCQNGHGGLPNGPSAELRGRRETWEAVRAGGAGDGGEAEEEEEEGGDAANGDLVAHLGRKKTTIVDST